MKSIMISIQPQWVEKILNREKTIEIRKTRPKCELPCKVYIYCTKHNNYKNSLYLADDNKYDVDYYIPSDDNFILNGKVVAEFTLNKVEKINCCAVPYRKTNNLGYERYVDDGVYQLKDNDGIVFERDDKYIDSMLKNKDFEKMQLKPIDVYNYLGGYGKFYAWHIDNLKIYDKPKELCEFGTLCMGEPYWKCDDCDYYYLESNEGGRYEECCCNNVKPMKRPPQSWCYAEEVRL